MLILLLYYWYWILYHFNDILSQFLTILFVQSFWNLTQRRHFWFLINIFQSTVLLKVLTVESNAIVPSQ